MSKFHSSVSRREFMKGLGLTGFGIGVNAATSGFHDIDEFVANKAVGMKYPWYVKRVDQPTTEVDWQTIKRFDATGGWKEEYFFVNPTVQVPLLMQQIKQDIANKVPGRTLRDHALFVGSAWGAFGWPAQAAGSFIPNPQRPGKYELAVGAKEYG